MTHFQLKCVILWWKWDFWHPKYPFTFKCVIFDLQNTLLIQFMRNWTIKRSRKPVDRSNPELSLFRTIKNHKSQMFNFSNLIPHELKRLNQSLELNFEAGNSKNLELIMILWPNNGRWNKNGRCIRDGVGQIICG